MAESTPGIPKNGILVIGETYAGKLQSISQELLGAGRILADALGQPLSVLLMGENLQPVGLEAIAYGADQVFLAESPDLRDYHPESFLQLAVNTCQEKSPLAILLGQTDLGLDLAPRLAAKLGGGLSMDCVSLSVEPASKRILATRPVYGGNAIATYAIRGERVQLVTVRPHAFSPAARDTARQGQVKPLLFKPNPADMKIKILKRVHEEASGVKLEDARVVVTGGYGVGGKEAFTSISELATLLGGAVGGTRPVCEQGWLPATCLVGQTGKIVQPDLYLAVGVSGAVQHMAGCGNAKCIVAINKDAEAPIFKVSHFGVVADCTQFLPKLKETLKNQMA
jgi:electron transfer flavoprotein alpha subunit